MAYQEIEINTDSLSKDIDSLNTQLESVKTNLDAMFDNMSELDAMWDGPANTEFMAQFKSDHEFMTEMCNTIAELIACLSFANKEYNSCENQVDSIISAIDI